MSIATDKARIEGAKAELSQWLTTQGISVPVNTSLDGLVSLLDAVQTGGSASGGETTLTLPYMVATGSITPTADVTATLEVDTGFQYASSSSSFVVDRSIVLLYLEDFITVPVGSVSVSRAVSRANAQIYGVGLDGNGSITSGNYVGGGQLSGGTNSTLTFKIWGATFATRSNLLSGYTYRWVLLFNPDLEV